MVLLMTTRPSATARRSVAGFADTSTMPSLAAGIDMGEGGAGAGGFPWHQRRPVARTAGSRDNRARGVRYIGLAHQALLTRKVEIPARVRRQRLRRENAAFANDEPSPSRMSGASVSLVDSVVSKNVRRRCGVPVHADHR